MNSGDRHWKRWLFSDFVINNCWIVPYSSHISKTFKTHYNVEYSNSVNYMTSSPLIVTTNLNKLREANTVTFKFTLYPTNRKVRKEILYTILLFIRKISKPTNTSNLLFENYLKIC